jgi:hypothetical protein
MATLTDQELLDYSREHVYYEIDMFLHAARLLCQPMLHPLVTNIALESFVIHLRNPVAFLYPSRILSDDVVAAQFCDAARFAHECPMTPVVDAARERANKEIGHLTTKRMAGSPVAKRWDVSGLTGEMINALQSFSALASSDRLHPRVKDQIRAATSWLAGHVVRS